MGVVVADAVADSVVTVSSSDSHFGFKREMTNSSGRLTVMDFNDGVFGLSTQTGNLSIQLEFIEYEK